MVIPSYQSVYSNASLRSMRDPVTGRMMKVHGHAAGHEGTPTYRSWLAMRCRCYRERDQDYARYGGRGIRVCERWRDSFPNFLADMGERPTGMTLDRKDSDLDYSPENCRWSGNAVQGRNKSTTKLDADKVREIRARLARGELQREIAAHFGITQGLVSEVKRGARWADITP